MRLNKYLAHAAGISRREADDLIDQARVTVNGTPASLGLQVEGSEVITVDGRLLPSKPESYVYIMLNKPVGYVCSRKRQGESPTIYELLPAKYRALKSVGRLDRDSSGLLIMTDDGDFAHRMTHPSFHKNKTYEIALDRVLEPLHRQMISDHGVTLEDGVSQLQLERLDEGDDTQWRVVMHEGRNRQIRRTFAALGYTVVQLHRIEFGNYILNDLPPGSIKTITI